MWTYAIRTTTWVGVATGVERATENGTYGLGRPTILLGILKIVILEALSREGYIDLNRMYSKTKFGFG